MRQEMFYLLLAIPDAPLPLEEALNLLLRPMRHIVPHPVTGSPYPRCFAQEGKVVEVCFEVCMGRHTTLKAHRLTQLKKKLGIACAGGCAPRPSSLRYEGCQLTSQPTAYKAKQTCQFSHLKQQ